MVRGTATLRILGLVKDEFRMCMCERSSSVSIRKSSVRVEICHKIRQTEMPVPVFDLHQTHKSLIRAVRVRLEVDGKFLDS